MRINTNVAALNAYRNLGETNNAVSSSMQKLSSGFRINKAGDDAAGLGIANKLRADVRSMAQANRNAEQANSVLSIAEGATGSVQKMLERMKELATQAGSDSVDTDGRARINEEFKALRSEIQRTADTTKFQGKSLINGTFGNSVDTSTNAFAGGVHKATISGAQAGNYSLSAAAGASTAGTLTMTLGTVSQTINVAADGKQTVSFDKFGISLELDASFTTATASAAGTLNGDTLTVTAGSGGGSFLISSSGSYDSHDVLSLESMNFTSTGLGLGAADNTGGLIDVASSRAMMATLDTAMETVNTTLGKIGASQNRIENAMSNLKTSIQNFTAAESVIRDLDMAEEMTKFSKSNILAQAGTAMLAQANQSAQGVLQLLRG